MRDTRCTGEGHEANKRGIIYIQVRDMKHVSEGCEAYKQEISGV